MQRKIASLPEDVAELCLIRVGIQARRWTAWPFVSRLGKAIDRSASEAIAADAGLFHSERFAFNLRHFGVLQYWRSFDDLEQWVRRPPHSEWWRQATERGRTKRDIGVYHEVFLVPRTAIESIYLDCSPVGLSAFGTLGEPVGSLTTSRDRLGRRSSSL
ncbi:MAG: hypothetical protein JWN86_2009 [Planctomycetota bacterium]|nr:hypothetical protein [Planctomycetota bacterium]